LPGVGVFGGSFNPIHFGHLLVADHVCEVLDLDRMLFVPAAAPPHKPAADLAPARHRHAMTELAVREHPRFAVSDVELRRAGPSYSVDTLQALAAEGALHFLIGSETFVDLLSWKEPRQLARLARLVVVPRTGSDFDPEGPAARKVLAELGLSGFAPIPAGAVGPMGPPPPADMVWLIAAPSLPISGSDLRRRAREGRSLAYRMPESVAAYIRTHRLYRQED
jgi:nicotinate-nucleotide adenylyltransferase